MIDALSLFTNDGNKNTTQYSSYLTETMLNCFEIYGITEGVSLMTFNNAEGYQQKHPGLMEKTNGAKCRIGSFCGAGNTIPNLITYYYKISSLKKLQKYRVTWYHFISFILNFI